MPKKDYYTILEVPRGASDDDIKKAYRKLAMQYHPDRNPGKEKWANEKFKGINEAYGVLGNPDKRKQYDQFGTTGEPGDVFGNYATTATFEDLMKEFGGQGLGYDFLDNVFGDFMKGRDFSFRQYGRPGSTTRIIFNVPEDGNLEDVLAQQQAARPRTRGRRVSPDIDYEITITAEQAKKGMEKDLVRKGKRLRVKIPAGIKPGTRIRLRNARMTTDRVLGDIYIRVLVKGEVS
ncbi:MAG: DnaJ domain-containing protein [Dehalococcoidia bacterium]|nr:DnaJ domain-containing protein [Dehalococcoidia bacterium]